MICWSNGINSRLKNKDNDILGPGSDYAFKACNNNPWLIIDKYEIANVPYPCQTSSNHIDKITLFTVHLS